MEDNTGEMFQIHVALDEPTNWLQLVPTWLTALAALITVFVARRIAHNQNTLQTTLGEKQAEIQKMQLELQGRQLKKDLFDKRFAVYTDVLDFLSYVLNNNGQIQLAGPGEYRQFRQCMERAEMLFGDDVRKYIADVDETARRFYVSAQTMDVAISKGDVDAIMRNGDLLSRLSVDLLQQRTAVFRPYLLLDF
jgi:hypothetical protein